MENKIEIDRLPTLHQEFPPENGPWRRHLYLPRRPQEVRTACASLYSFSFSYNKMKYTNSR